MITDEEAREAAREILSGEVYTRWTDQYDAWLNLFDRLAEMTPDFILEGVSALIRALEGLGDWITSILNALGIGGDVAPVLGWLAVGAILAFLIYLVAQHRMRRAGQQVEADRGAVAADLHGEAMREAQHAADQGRFLEAAHRVQLASLAFLIEGGWLELARSDANPTLRARISGSALPAAERAEFIALVDQLEARWFGGSETSDDPALYEGWLSLDRRLRSLGVRGVPEDQRSVAA